MHQFMLCVCCVPTADSDPALPPPTAVIPGTTAGLPAHHYLITPSIYLSPLDNHDTNAIISHLNNPLITSTLYGVSRPYTRQHAKSWVKDARRATQANRGVPLTYSIRVAATGEHIGVVSLSPWSSARTSFAPTRMPTPFGSRAGTIEEPWSIGYYLDTRFWGRGIMPMCVWTVVQKVAVEQMGRRAFRVPVFYGNVRSRRVLEKCGFRLVQEERGMWWGEEGRSLDGWIFEARVA